MSGPGKLIDESTVFLSPNSASKPASIMNSQNFNMDVKENTGTHLASFRDSDLKQGNPKFILDGLPAINLQDSKGTLAQRNKVNHSIYLAFRSILQK
jgi:hypothetical protein